MKLVPLISLVPPRRFHLPYSGLTGTLFAVSDCAATVRFDGITVRQVDTMEGPREFVAPANRMVTISAGSMVEDLGPADIRRRSRED